MRQTRRKENRFAFISSILVNGKFFFLSLFSLSSRLYAFWFMCIVITISFPLQNSLIIQILILCINISFFFVVVVMNQHKVECLNVISRYKSILSSSYEAPKLYFYFSISIFSPLSLAFASLLFYAPSSIRFFLFSISFLQFFFLSYHKRLQEISDDLLIGMENLRMKNISQSFFSCCSIFWSPKAEVTYLNKIRTE